MIFDLARRPVLVNLLCAMLFFVIATSIFAAEPVGLGADQVFNHLATPIERMLVDGADMWPFAAQILTTFVLLVNSFYITRLTIRNVVYLSRSFIPAMFLICMGFSSFSSICSFIPLISMSFILMSIGEMTASYSIKGLATGRWFIIGVYASLAGMIYMPNTLFTIMIPVGLLMFRQGDVREWVASVAGYGLVLFYCALADCFAMGGEFLGVFGQVAAFWGNMSPLDGVLGAVESYSLPDWVLLGAAALASILSIVKFVFGGVIYKPLEMRTFEFLLLMLFITALVVVLSGVSMVSFVPLLSMALAFVLPAYFVNYGGTFISNFLFVLIIGSALIKMLLF